MTDNFNEEEYVSGFNKGYYLAKEFPEIADILKDATGTSDRLAGMKDGREQFLGEAIDKDKENANQPNWLRDNRLEEIDNTIDKSINLNKDIDEDAEI